MSSYQRTPPEMPAALHSELINGVQLQGEMFGGYPAVVRPARVWVVDPTRGDLYVVHLSETNNQFVRLIDGGIVDKTEHVLNTEMQVKCDLDGNVIALPVERCYNTWSRCVPMGARLVDES